MSATCGTRSAGRGPAWSAPLTRRLPRAVQRCPVTWCVSLTALVLYGLRAIGVDLSALELSAAALSAGRWWTIFSGHLLHLSPTHLGFCVAGLVVVGYVFEPLFGRTYAAVAAAVAAVVALGFVVAHGELSGYCGLSSLDQGLFVAGLAALWRRGERRVAAVLIALLAGKWAFELLASTSLLASLTLDEKLYGVAVPWTHVAGGVAGLLTGIVATRANGRDAPTTR